MYPEKYTPRKPERQHITLFVNRIDYTDYTYRVSHQRYSSDQIHCQHALVQDPKDLQQ